MPAGHPPVSRSGVVWSSGGPLVAEPCDDCTIRHAAVIVPQTPLPHQPWWLMREWVVGGLLRRDPAGQVRQVADGVLVAAGLSLPAPRTGALSTEVTEKLPSMTRMMRVPSGRIMWAR